MIIINRDMKESRYKSIITISRSIYKENIVDYLKTFIKIIIKIIIKININFINSNSYT